MTLKYDQWVKNEEERDLDTFQLAFVFSMTFLVA